MSFNSRFRSEFVMWAAEAKGINVESLPKWEEKDLFKYAAQFGAVLESCDFLSSFHVSGTLTA